MLTNLGIRSNNIYNSYKVKNNNPESTTLTTTKTQDDFIKTSEPAFKGRKKLNFQTFSKGKKALLTLAGFFGVKTTADSINSKNNESDYKIQKKLWNIYDNTWDPVSKTEIEALSNVYKNYPKLVEGLARRTYVEKIDCEEIKQASYSPDDIVYIVNTYQENPNLAYKLAIVLEKKSGNYHRCDNAQRDFLLKKINENYPIVEKFSKTSKSPLETIKLITSYEKDPDLTLEIHKTNKYSANETSNLINIAKKHKDKVKDLALNKDIKFSPRIIELLIPKYSEDKDSIADFASFIKYYEIQRDDIEQDAILYNTLDSFKKNSNLTEDLLLAKWNTKDINLGVEAYSIAPKFIHDRFANDLFNRNYCKNYSAKDALLLAKYAKVHADYLPLIEKSLSESPSTEEYIRLIKLLYRNKSAVERIIRDNRALSVSHIENLIELYEMNPDTEITQEMIEYHKNPLAKLFNQ